jgi:hypothetical protein
MKMPSHKHIAMGLVLVAGLSLPVAAHAVDYANDGYLSWDEDSDCLLLTQHDGKVVALTGAIDGLDEDDHVRIFGHNVRGAECNDYDGPAYQVTDVFTIWGNDKHSTTYYDHETDGSFQRWAQRNRGE